MSQRLHFFYELKLEFSNPIMNHYVSNKIEPKSSLRQTIESVHYEIVPFKQLKKSEDGFGNLVVYGSLCQAHNQYEIVMEGIATTEGQAKEERVDDSEYIVFKYPTRFTMAGERLHIFYREIQKDIENKNIKPCNLAEYYMKQLGKNLCYKKGSSSIETVAENAFVQGYGVCQDYSHILISLLRLSKIPARYVVGLMLGEGESHAWVEVFQDGFWYGIDPTNQKWVDENYIKLSAGRDYQDCIISKGIFEGVTLQNQSVCARVTREEGINKIW